MKERRIMLMSGYLGSGKTTSMVALAKYFNANGTKACLITNDLGSNLVDTAYVNDNEISVLEISNGCLCHDVPQLLEKINRHIENTDADIVIFEPVGSCVDMVEHVYKDISTNHHNSYTLAPVSAIVDPVRFHHVYIEGKTGTNVSNAAVAYGFQKQLEEADLLLLNKVDLLSEKEIADIRASMEKFFPDVPVIEISGLKEWHIDRWADYVMKHTSSIRDLDIDMDLIMKGCEDMGWYNKVSAIESEATVNMMEICEEYLHEVKAGFAAADKEILHAKVHAEKDGKFVKSALTSTDGKINSVGNLEEFKGKGALNVNIRGLLMPEPLAAMMEEKLKKILNEHHVKIVNNALQSFLPVEEPPEPRERF